MELRELRGWLLRLFGVFQRRQHEQEFAEELASHLALHMEDNLRAGMSPEEARCHAFIKLGGVAQTQELHREQRGLLAVEAVVRRERHRTPDVRRAGVFADTGCPVGLMDTRMAGRAG